MTYDPVASAGPFPIDFPVFDEDGVDLKVTVDAVERTDWTFTGTLESGFLGAPNTWVDGSITFDAPITGALVIKGRRAPRRQSQYAEGRGVPARDHNTEINLLTAVDQELRRDVDEFVDRLDDLDEAVALAEAAQESSETAADVSIAAAAVAMNAAEETQGLLASIVNFTLNTRTELAASLIAGLVKVIETRGYGEVGDGGGAVYKRVDAEPSHVGKVRSLDRFLSTGVLDLDDGGWWEIVTRKLYSRQVGVHLAGSDALTAFQGFLDVLEALDAPGRVNRGDIYSFPTGTLDLHAGIDLDWRGATLQRTADLTIPLMQSLGAAGTHIRQGEIRGGTLKYTPLTTSVGITNSCALWIKFSDEWHVKRLRVEGQFYIGVRYDDIADCTLKDSYFHGLFNRAIYSTATVFSQNLHVSDCTCNGYKFGTTTPLTNHIVNVGAFGGTADNITFTRVTSMNADSVAVMGEAFAVGDQAANVIFDNCRARNCPTGFYVTTVIGGSDFRRVKIMNCAVDNCWNGILGTDGAYLTVIGNQVSGSKDYQYRFADVSGLVLTGNTADNGQPGCDAFVFDGALSVATVTGNIAFGHTASGGVGGHGFRSTAGTSGITAEANSASASANDIPYSIAGTGHNFPNGVGTSNI